MCHQAETTNEVGKMVGISIERKLPAEACETGDIAKKKSVLNKEMLKTK